MSQLLVSLRLRYKGWYDAVSMALYVLTVYGLALWTGPLGRDHARLAELAARRADSADWTAEDAFLCMLVDTFGDWAVGYHLANLALLLGCMMTLYFLVCAIVRGPFWLGTLAAVLFMANPAVGAGVLHITSSDYLLPTFAGLAALLLWTLYRFRPRVWSACTGWTAMIGVVCLFRAASPVWLVALLLEVIIVPRERRSRTATSGLVVLGLLSTALWLPDLRADYRGVGDLLAPLYFLAYPLGFLPRTAKVFHDWPGTAWAAGITGIVVLAMVVRRANRRAVLFGLVAALSLRLACTDEAVDLVHLTGMGQLLLPSALYHLGLVALFLRMMDHPRWKTAVIAGTTLLCVVYMTIQVHHVFMWRHADSIVLETRARVEALLASGREAVALCPDLRYMGGAPVCLSDALLHSTPFATALPVVPVLPIHHRYSATYELEDWSESEGTVLVEGSAPVEFAPWPYTLATPGLGAEFDGVQAVVESVGPPARIQMEFVQPLPMDVVTPGRRTHGLGPVAHAPPCSVPCLPVESVADDGIRSAAVGATWFPVTAPYDRGETWPDPMCCSSCPTTTRPTRWGATEAESTRRRIWTESPKAGCGSTTASAQTRSARRAGRRS